MGWPPTKRGWSTLATMGPLMPATSVTTPPASSASAAASATAPAGVAMKVISGVRSVPISSRAPSSRARGFAVRVAVAPRHPPAPLAQAPADGAADQAGADDLGPRLGAGSVESRARRRAPGGGAWHDRAHQFGRVDGLGHGRRD